MRCQLVYHQRVWGACHAWQAQNWLTGTSGCDLGGVAWIVRDAGDCSVVLVTYGYRCMHGAQSSRAISVQHTFLLC